MGWLLARSAATVGVSPPLALTTILQRGVTNALFLRLRHVFCSSRRLGPGFVSVSVSSSSIPATEGPGRGLEGPRPEPWQEPWSRGPSSSFCPH